MSEFNRDEAIIGQGKQLSYSDTEEGEYTTIGGTVEINLPERELASEEITNDDSPDRHKDYIPGLFEPGTTSFTYIYGKTQFAQIETVYQLAKDPATVPQATKFWKFALPDGSIASWRGFITKHNLPTEIEKAVTVEGEMQVIGAVEFAPAGDSE